MNAITNAQELADIADFKAGRFVKSVMDALIDEEPNEEVVEIRKDRLKDEIMERAMDFLGQYKSLDKHLANEGKNVLPEIATMVKNEVMSNIDAMRYIERLNRQCTQVIFYELHRREKARSRAAEQVAAPIKADPVNHSPALMGILNALGALELLEGMPGVSNVEGDIVRDCEEQELWDTLEDIHANLGVVRDVFYFRQFRESPTQLMGYMDFNIPGTDKWYSATDATVAYDMFVAKMEDKKITQAAREKETADKVLSYLASKRGK